MYVMQYGPLFWRNLPIAGFLLGILFNLKDGGDAFLWNITGLLLNHTAL
jgi:hypothetical protein